MDTQCEEQELFIDKCTVYIVICNRGCSARSWLIDHMDGSLGMRVLEWHKGTKITDERVEVAYIQFISLSNLQLVRGQECFFFHVLVFAYTQVTRCFIV